jgi:hypothetical protein
VVVAEQLVQEVNGIVADKSLVVGVDERVPWLLGVPAENVVVLSIQLNVVLVEVVEQVLGSENLGNLDQLVRVAVSVEEGLASEDHGRKHGAQRPHVERVVVLLEIDKQLGSLEVAGGNADVILGARVVELSKTPVDQPQLYKVSRVGGLNMPRRTLRFSWSIMTL